MSHRFDDVSYLAFRRLPAGVWAVALLVVIGVVATPSVPAAQQWGGEDATVEMQQDDQDEQDDEQPQEDQPPAEQSEADEPPPPAEEAERIEAQRRAEREEQQIRDSVRRQIEESQNAVHIYQIAEEMVDEVIADVSQLNSGPLAPTAVRRTNLTPNLNDQFGQFVESTLITGLANHTDVTVKRCVACNATRSTVDDDNWVITRGLVDQEDLAREAERLGVNTFVDAQFGFYPGANIVAMQVEFSRAEDGAVLWSETYRSDATTAAVLRSGDRVESREDRIAELERRIDARPYYGHQLSGGFGYIPYDAPDGGLGGMMLGYRLYEKFGADLQYLYGIGADGFANFGEGDEIMGGFVYGTLQAEIFRPNLNDPVLRTGPAVGGFMAGSEGNSVVVEWGLDAIFQFRLGAGASLFYFVPTEFAGHDLGGFGMKGRISFNW